LAIWSYAFFNLLSKGCFFTIVAYVLVLGFWNSPEFSPLSPLFVPLALVFFVGCSFVLNCLLLIPMKSLFIAPAGLMSVFLNMPWVAARPDTPGCIAANSSWPSWVLIFVHSIGTVYYGGRVLVAASKTPAPGDTLMMGIGVVGAQMKLSCSTSEPLPRWLAVVSSVGTIAVTLLSLLLFLIISGRVHKEVL
jgi:hypothetical protein